MKRKFAAEDSEGRSERLRIALAKRGGQTAVAKEIKIPQTSLSNYLAGRDMPLPVAARVAAACHVSLEWLATGKGDLAAGDMAVKVRPSIMQAVADAYSHIKEKFYFDLGMDWFQETAIRTEKYVRAQELRAAETPNEK
jgi:hypothetical protein